MPFLVWPRLIFEDMWSLITGGIYLRFEYWYLHKEKRQVYSVYTDSCEYCCLVGWIDHVWKIVKSNIIRACSPL